MTATMDALLRNAIAAAGWQAEPPGDPATPAAYLGLLRPLHGAGRRDLPLGRLLEGHVDAGQIVRRYGSAAQVAALAAAVRDGATLGVWNAALPGEPLRLAGDRLTGAKSYASGTGVLSHALVTADTDAGPQLLLLDLARIAPAIEDDWWRVTGMGRSATHRVRWAGATVSAAERIGEPGDYSREPWFSGGALRFVAVHAGGIAGLLDRTRDHLVAAGRAEDPFQLGRLDRLHRLAAGAAALVRRTAETWFETEGEAQRAHVAAVRLAVADAGIEAIALAQEAVGLPGAFLDHPLAAHAADLAVYLRQPVPDAQRLRVGRAAAAGLLAIGL